MKEAVKYPVILIECTNVNFIRTVMQKGSLHTNGNVREKGATNELALSKRCQSNS